MHTALQLRDFFFDEQPGKHVVFLSVQVAGSSSTIPESTCNPSLQEQRLHVIDRKTGIKFLVDSGSIVSLLPRTFATRQSFPRALKLTAANGSSISTYGQRLLAIDLGLGRILPWAFIVADVKSAIFWCRFACPLRTGGRS